MKTSPVIKLIMLTTFFHFLTPSNCHRINSKLYDQQLRRAILPSNDNELIENTNHHNDLPSIAYVKASIPTILFKCITRLSILKCIKIFFVQRLTDTITIRNSGNVTADFLNQLLAKEQGRWDILDKKYINMSDDELNGQLLSCFQKFFKNREIQLHFIPGVMVKLVASNTNSFSLAIKKRGI